MVDELFINLVRWRNYLESSINKTKWNRLFTREELLYTDNNQKSNTDALKKPKVWLILKLYAVLIFVHAYA